MVGIDPSSAVPRYHQIAEALRYEIATGVIRPGTKLPTLKDGANRWGVNMHTVRRAYQALAERGVVETRTPGGTHVLPGADGTAIGSGSNVALRRFVIETLRTAQDRFGLSPEQLVALFSSAGSPEARLGNVVSVVECSETQCVDLAQQIAHRWRVRAIPWCLDKSGEPPPGSILSTYFHYNDVRLRWPARLTDMRFVAIRPDAALATSLQNRRRRGQRHEIVLCERQRLMADSIAADLRALLSPRDFHVGVLVTRSPVRALRTTGEGTSVLVSPRVWGELDPALRANAHVFEVRYVFEEREITAIATELGWSTRRQSPAAPKVGRRARA